MNSGSGGFSLEPISQDNLLVTLSLALIAVLAILTVIAMIWGARLKRQRKAAEAEEQRRIEELKAEGVVVTNIGDRPTPPVVERSSTAGVAAPPADPAPVAPEPVAQKRPAALSDEPIAAAAPMDASPASVAADAPTGDAAPGAESVTILKGLGPKIATRLAELGITRLDQLAWLDDAEAEQLDAQLGVFQGRMERDRWREQARLLANGDRAAYEAQFGKLG